MHPIAICIQNTEQTDENTSEISNHETQTHQSEWQVSSSVLSELLKIGDFGLMRFFVHEGGEIEHMSVDEFLDGGFETAVEALSRKAGEQGFPEC